MQTLTEKESKILKELLTGSSNKEIGSALGCSPNTIRNQVSELFKKFKVTNRVELVMKVVKLQ